MDVVLTEDQDVFRQTTDRFLRTGATSPPSARWAPLPTGSTTGYWRQGAELGWTSLLVPEADGGGSVSGRGVVDLTVVADAFGRHVAPGPLSPVNVVAAALARVGGAGRGRAPARARSPARR